MVANLIWLFDYLIYEQVREAKREQESRSKQVLLELEDETHNLSEKEQKIVMDEFLANWGGKPVTKAHILLKEVCIYVSLSRYVFLYYIYIYVYMYVNPSSTCNPSSPNNANNPI